MAGLQTVQTLISAMLQAPNLSGALHIFKSFQSGGSSVGFFLTSQRGSIIDTPGKTSYLKHLGVKSMVFGLNRAGEATDACREKEACVPASTDSHVWQ